MSGTDALTPAESPESSLPHLEYGTLTRLIKRLETNGLHKRHRRAEWSK